MCRCRSLSSLSAPPPHMRHKHRDLPEQVREYNPKLVQVSLALQPVCHHLLAPLGPAGPAGRLRLLGGCRQRGPPGLCHTDPGGIHGSAGGCLPRVFPPDAPVEAGLRLGGALWHRWVETPPPQTDSPPSSIFAQESLAASSLTKPQVQRLSALLQRVVVGLFTQSDPQTLSRPHL